MCSDNPQYDASDEIIDGSRVFRHPNRVQGHIIVNYVLEFACFALLVEVVLGLVGKQISEYLVLDYFEQRGEFVRSLRNMFFHCQLQVDLIPHLCPYFLELASVAAFFLVVIVTCLNQRACQKVEKRQT